MMARQLQSEAIKLLSVRGTYAVVLGGLAIAAIGGTVLGSPVSEVDHPPVHLHPFLGMFVMLVGVFAFLLAARAVTDEHRHGTIVWTSLAQPKPSVVMAARAVVFAAAGAVLGVLAGTVALTVAALTASAGTPVLDLGRAAPLVGGLAVASGLWAAAASALAALIRHQVAVVAGGIVWFLFGEQLLGFLLKDAQRFLPGMAGAGLAGSPTEGLLGRGEAALVLLGVTLVAVVAAVIVSRARDTI